MPRGKAAQDTATLAMALVGYELERQKIEGKISELKRALGKGGTTTKAVSKTDAAPVKRRTLSASARKRIATAQKKRWAEHRKALAAQNS